MGRKLLIFLIMAVVGIWFLQTSWAHRPGSMLCKDYECQPLLGWITREDLRTVKCEEGWAGATGAKDSALVESVLSRVQTGDILITFSTHTLGWRHGHAAIVVDDGRTLECGFLGEEVDYGRVKRWKEYSTVAVLRMKEAGREQNVLAADFALNELLGRSYSLLAGFPLADEKDVQCAYMVWLAWNHLGYDLNSDGGWLVTPRDIYESEHVEIVAKWGL